MNKLLVVGATGLLGKATIKYFKTKKNWSRDQEIMGNEKKSNK